MKGNKFWAFMKKNAFYFVLGFCLLAIALSFTFYAVSQNKKPVDSGQQTPVDPDDGKDPDGEDPTDPEDPDEPTIVEVVFQLPVANGTVIKGYSADQPVFNQTLER